MTSISARRFVASLALAATLSVVLTAVDSDKAVYVGGTIAALQEKAEGRISTASDTELNFNAGKKGSVVIPYAGVTSLEYGQKAGRRVGVAIMISPLALFSKKRNHYLTISFDDAAGKEQAAVFELGKDIVRTTLKILEVRTGKELILQDKEACHQFKSPKECEGK